MKNIHLALIILVIIFSSGCSHLQHQNNFKYISYQERTKNLKKIKSWHINGVIGITNHNNNQRDIVNFSWVQNNDKYQIDIYGPLNFKLAEITGDETVAQICHSNHKCHQAKNAELLLNNLSGWKLPISNLKYWLFTLPTPSQSAKHTTDQYGHAINITQQNWQIFYSSYCNISKFNTDLPSIIKLENNNFSIKLKIKNY